MEASMCWEVDYAFFVELEKAKRAEKAQEKRAEVIGDLLSAANKQAEPGAEAPANEPVSAK
jgi:hypothetical protein